MSRTSDPAPSASDHEIVSMRVFDAPRELIFRAFADPEQLAKWWGPSGFTNTIHEFDLRPGGVWRHTMHAPDGTDYHNESVFVEVVEPERVVFDHLKPIHRFRMTITLADQGGKTAVTWRMRFESAEECAKVRAFAAPANEQNFDRLAEHLTAADKPFVISRTFDAPRDLVWKAWTEPERLAKWWGPKGFTVISCDLDLRPGGVFHYGLKSPDDKEMWGKFVFREVTPPDRLVFLMSFSDPAGGITRHPFSADWPLDTLSTLTFADAGNQTTLTLTWVPINATDTERKAFAAAHDGKTTGWTGTLDQLAAHLATG